MFLSLCACFYGFHSVFPTHFSVLSPFQRFIPILAFYPQFSVLSPFHCFIPISVFYPHFSVIPISAFKTFIPISISVFSFRFSHSVSAFYPDPFAFGGSCGSLPVTVGYQKWDIMLHRNYKNVFPQKVVMSLNTWQGIAFLGTLGCIVCHYSDRGCVLTVFWHVMSVMTMSYV